MRLHLTLPYPPSMNHYWHTTVIRRGRRFVPHVYIGKKGDLYRRKIGEVLKGVPRLTGPVEVHIMAQPPDKRRRDLDNLLKCLLDSLTKAGLWEDDSQVVGLLVQWGKQVRGGQVNVFVETR